MIKKQLFSLLLSLALSSSLLCASAATPKCKPANKPVRVLKSALSLMGHTGLATCSGATLYFCAVISSDSKSINPLAVMAGVPSIYGVWGGAKGILRASKEIFHIFGEKYAAEQKTAA